MSFKICLYAICYSICISRSGYWNQNTLHAIVCNASTSNFVIPKSVDICRSSIQVHSNEQMMHQRFQCNSANIKQTLEVAISNSFKQNTGFLIWTDSCCFACINQESSKDKDLFSVVSFSSDSFVKHTKHINGLDALVDMHGNQFIK